MDSASEVVSNETTGGQRETASIVVKDTETIPGKKSEFLLCSNVSIVQYNVFTPTRNGVDHKHTCH